SSVPVSFSSFLAKRSSVFLRMRRRRHGAACAVLPVLDTHGNGVQFVGGDRYIHGIGRVFANGEVVELRAVAVERLTVVDAVRDAFVATAVPFDDIADGGV